MALIGGGFISAPSPVSGQKDIAVGKTKADTGYILDVLKSNDSTVPSLKVEQTGSGDAAIQMKTSDVSWSIGIDNDDSDIFKISNSAALATDTALTITGSDLVVKSNVYAGIGNKNSVHIGFNEVTANTVGLFGKQSISGSDNNLWIAPRNINSSNGSYIMLGQRDSTDDNAKGNIVIKAGTEGTNNQQGNIDINSSAHSGRIYIKGDTGLVGIGHDSPNAKLHVLRSGNKEVARFESTSVTGSRITIESDSNLSSTVGERDGHLVLQDSNARRVAIGFDQPDTLFHMSGTDPYMTFTNTAHEDDDGGRESKFIFEGSKADETQHHLAEIKVSHHGSGDDKIGQFNLSLNDGSDSNGSLTDMFTIAGDDKVLHTSGSIKVGGNIAGGANYDIYAEYVNRGRINLLSGTSGNALQMQLLSNGVGRVLIYKNGEVEISSGLLDIYNNTESDSDGARATTLTFKGETSSGGSTYDSIKHELGMIKVSHDGDANDKKGKLDIALNDGDDSDGSLTNVLTVASNEIVASKTIYAKSGAGQTPSDLAISFKSVDVANPTGFRYDGTRFYLHRESGYPGIGFGATPSGTTGRRSISFSNDNVTSFFGKSGSGVGEVGMKTDGVELMLNQTTLNCGVGLIVLPDDNIGIGNGATFHADATYNIGIGTNALNATTGTATSNVAVGRLALSALTTGDNNVAIGSTAGEDVTTGYSNMLLGSGAGDSLTEGFYNVALGGGALQSSTTGNRDVAIGFSALNRVSGSNVNGNLNVAIGYRAGQYVSSGRFNMFIGAYSGWGWNATDIEDNAKLQGNGNVGIGYYTLRNVQTYLTNHAYNNIGIGTQSGQAITYGNSNVGIGPYTMAEGANTYYNIAIGTDAGRYLSTNHNVTIGYQALINGETDDVANNTGAINIAIGSYAMGHNSGDDVANFTAEKNIVIGYKALSENLTANRQVVIGHEAMVSATTNKSDYGNVVIGYEAGKHYKGGTNTGWNVFIGDNSGEKLGYDSTSSANAQNVFVGALSGRNGTGSGSDYTANTARLNTAIGYASMGLVGGGAAFTGTENTAVGQSSLGDITSGTQNVGLGAGAGSSITTGAGNMCIGKSAVGKVTIGSNNTAIGNYALYITPTGSDAQTAIGYFAGAYLGGSAHNTIIGALAMKGGYNTEDPAGDGSVGWADNTANRNIAIGYKTIGGDVNTSTALTSEDNVVIGFNAGPVMSGADDNVIIGYESGKALTTGNDNIAIGSSALLTEDTGSDNIAIGNEALNLQNLDDSGYNVAIGNNAGKRATATQYSFFLGDQAGSYVTTANNNIALGFQTLGAGKATNRLRGYGDGGGMAAYSGERNIAIGYRALYSLSNYIQDSDTLILGTAASSYNNTVIGAYAGVDMVTAKQNTLIGASAGQNVLGNLNTMIGSGAGSNVFNANNVIAIGAMGSYSGQTGCVAIGVGAFKNLRVSGGISTVDNTTPSVVGGNWEGSGSYTNIGPGYCATNAHFNKTDCAAAHSGQWTTTQTSANGTGATFDITTDGDGDVVTFTVNNPGYGYLSDDELTFRDPGNTSNTAVVIVNATLSETDRQVAIGYNAGVDLTYGVGNTLLGNEAGQNLTTGNYNMMLGKNAGNYATTASYSMFIGSGSGGASGGSSLTGDNNLCVGYGAGYDIEGGCTQSTFIGNYAGYSTTTGGQGNTAIGYQSLYTSTVSLRNTAIGYQALYTHNLGSTDYGNNTAIGFTALKALTDGQKNTAIGTEAGVALTAGDDNIAIGYQALNAEDTGDKSIAIGNEALKAQDYDGDSGNIGIGYQAGLSNTSGIGNVYMGLYAGRYVTTGTRNIFIGRGAGQGVVGNKLTGSSNVAIGDYAGSALQAGAAQNHFIGDGAGQNVTTGWQNFAIGRHSLDAEVAGNRSVAIGNAALTNATQGTNTQVENTAIGYGAGDTVTSGINCTFIGGSSDGDATSSGQVAIGQNAITQNDNEVRIGHQGGVQFMSTEVTLNKSGTDTNDPAHETPIFKIPAYSVIIDSTAVITQLSNLSDYKLKLVTSTASSATDGTAVSVAEILYGGLTTEKDGEGDGSPTTIDCGSGAILKKAFYNHNQKGVGNADVYVYLVHADADGGETNPSTDGKVRVTIRFVGQD